MEQIFDTGQLVCDETLSVHKYKIFFLFPNSPFYCPNRYFLHRLINNFQINGLQAKSHRLGYSRWPWQL